LSIQPNSDAQSLASSISSDYAAMESSLAFSIGIGLNRSLRSRLRALAGASDGQAIFVSHLQKGAWLEIDPKGSVIARRQKPEGLPSIDLGQAVMREPALGYAVDAASTETRALRRARKLMEPLVRGWGLPSREQFGRLVEWSPVLEPLAYRCATRIGSLVDTIRYDIVESKVKDLKESEARLAQYWVAMHAMANTILLSSAPEANPWLSDMAKRIQWILWTPTFPLLRERTLWLAACAARSAIAFGHGVVEKYLRLVSHATHPVRVFDALYGLSAIALEDVDAARTVLAELRSINSALKRRTLEHLPLIEAAFSGAIETISEPDFELDDSDWQIRLLGWQRTSDPGLATPGALRADPATILSSGRYLGLAVLPFVISTPVRDFYPAKRDGTQTLDISVSEIAETVFRAWGSAERPSSRLTLH